VIDAGSLEYAHARIWARHGNRPDEALWHRIEVTRDLAAVLEIARASALGRWLEGIGPAADVHAIELAARRHWRERVAEVAQWMPALWRPAIDWCTLLVDLPAMQHLARNAAPLPWMTEDAASRGWVDASAHAADAPRVLLDAARADPQHLLALWRAEWQRRLPCAPGRAVLQTRLLPLLDRHAAAFAAPQAADGWALRRALQAALVLLLRRTLVEPTAAFVHLALSALEFERVRGEVLRRAAFPHRSPAS
jgi:hypothetical protein